MSLDRRNLLKAVAAGAAGMAASSAAFSSAASSRGERLDLDDPTDNFKALVESLERDQIERGVIQAA